MIERPHLDLLEAPAPMLTFTVRGYNGNETACRITVVPWYVTNVVDPGERCSGDPAYVVRLDTIESTAPVLPISDEVDRVATRVVGWSGYHHHSRPGDKHAQLCDGFHRMAAGGECPGGGTPIPCSRLIVVVALRAIPGLLEQTARAITDLTHSGLLR